MTDIILSICVLGLLITSPGKGAIVNAQHALLIAWMSDSPDDPSHASIYMIQNSTKFVRQIAIDIDLKVWSYIIPSFQETIPNGDGYQLDFVPVMSDIKKDILSEPFSVSNSTFGDAITSSVPHSLPHPSSSAGTNTSTTAASPTALPTVLATALTSPAIFPSSNSAGLTIGSRAGIAVGVIAGTVLTAFLAGLLFHRQSRKKRQLSTSNPERSPTQEEAVKVNNIAEIGHGAEKHELDGRTPWLRAELPGSLENRETHELPG